MYGKDNFNNVICNIYYDLFSLRNLKDYYIQYYITYIVTF